MINYEDFQKLQLKVGKVLSAERIAGSDKLLRLDVDLGESHATGVPARRQIIAGVGVTYQPESLVGCEIVILANLEPRVIMGLESQGMLLAAEGDAGPVLIVPQSDVFPGSVIK